MIKGQKHLSETRSRISLSLKGNPKLSFWKGKKLSLETRQKMRVSHLGSKNHFWGKTHTQEARLKIGEKHKRENLSQETLLKMSKASKGRKLSLEHKSKIREANWKRIYKPHSLEAKFKNKIAHLGKVPWNKDIPNFKSRGKNNLNWKGGVNPLNLKIRTSLEYKIWRRSVFERDQWMCVLGGKNHGCKLQAHHIKPFARYPELRFDLNNGITLCVNCHINLHKNGKNN